MEQAIERALTAAGVPNSRVLAGLAIAPRVRHCESPDGAHTCHPCSHAWVSMNMKTRKLRQQQHDVPLSPILPCPGTHCTGRRALFSDPAKYNHGHTHAHTHIHIHTHTHKHTHSHTNVPTGSDTALAMSSSVRERPLLPRSLLEYFCELVSVWDPPPGDRTPMRQSPAAASTTLGWFAVAGSLSPPRSIRCLTTAGQPCRPCARLPPALLRGAPSLQHGCGLPPSASSAMSQPLREPRKKSYVAFFVSENSGSDKSQESKP
jgi:hypothetical protein